MLPPITRIERVSAEIVAIRSWFVSLVLLECGVGLGRGTYHGADDCADD